MGSRQVAQRLVFEECLEAYQRAQKVGARSEARPRETVHGFSSGPELRLIGQAMDALAAGGCSAAAEFSLVHFRELHAVQADQILSFDLQDLRRQLFHVLVQSQVAIDNERALVLLSDESDLAAREVELFVRDLANAASARPIARAKAQLVLARLLAPWSGSGGQRSAASPSTMRRRAEALALYDSIIQRFEGTPVAARATADVWRLTHLKVGALAPDFLTHDLAGNEIRLSDFRGQVVVVHFTAADRADAGAALALSQVQERRYWDSRFAWVGVHRGGTRGQLQAALEDELPGGHQAWESGQAEQGAAWAWHMPAQETLVVLDPAGYVQAINPSGSALDGQITRLLNDLQQQGRTRKEGLAP